MHHFNGKIPPRGEVAPPSLVSITNTSLVVSTSAQSAVDCLERLKTTFRIRVEWDNKLY